MKDLLKEIVENKRVALVGPSPHLENKRLGSLIDSYDVICRLNEVHPKNLEHDYGTRTDIAFWSVHDAALPHFKQMIKEDPQKTQKIKLIVCPRNSLHVTPFHEGGFTKERNIFKNYNKLGIDNSFFHIGDELNQKIESSIGCHPTIGALSILCLLNYNIEKLYICGMSFFETKEKYNNSTKNTLIRSNNGIPPKCLNPKPGHNVKKEVDYLKQFFVSCKNVDGDYYFKKIFKNN